MYILNEYGTYHILLSEREIRQSTYLVEIVAKYTEGVEEDLRECTLFGEIVLRKNDPSAEFRVLLMEDEEFFGGEQISIPDAIRELRKINPVQFSDVAYVFLIPPTEISLDVWQDTIKEMVDRDPAQGWGRFRLCETIEGLVGATPLDTDYCIHCLCSVECFDHMVYKSKESHEKVIEKVENIQRRLECIGCQE